MKPKVHGFLVFPIFYYYKRDGAVINARSEWLLLDRDRKALLFLKKAVKSLDTNCRYLYNVDLLLILFTTTRKKVMKWVRLHNDGEFDVITAIGMIGASVKTSDDPIGLYGSGVKYAMAQAVRDGIPLKIADKGKVYTLTSKVKTFRGEDFDMICLKSSTGKLHETGITSDFGKEDWQDRWYIFREFYSNMLDENGSMDVVDTVQTSDGGVDVFLPYNRFRECVDKIDDHFTDREWSIRPGTGRCFKRGVYVGSLDQDVKFDIQADIELNESRSMSMYDAWKQVSNAFEYCDDSEVWKLLFDSPDCWEQLIINLDWETKGGSRSLSMHDGLVLSFGEAYAVCPNIENIIKDAVQVYRRVPVVLPSNWYVSKDVYCILNEIRDIKFREPEADEQSVIDKVMAKLSDFIKDDVRDKLVISINYNDAAGGRADKNGFDVAVCENIIKSDIKNKTYVNTMLVLLHEINHVQTRAGDYDRGFARGYESYLVSLME